MIEIFVYSSFDYILLVLEFVIYVLPQILSMSIEPDKIMKPIIMATNEADLAGVIISIKNISTLLEK
jgi:hypothetical protein